MFRLTFSTNGNPNRFCTKTRILQQIETIYFLLVMEHKQISSLPSNSVSLLLNPAQTTISYANDERKHVIDKGETSSHSTTSKNKFTTNSVAEALIPKIPVPDQFENNHSKTTLPRKVIDGQSASTSFTQNNNSHNPYLYTQHRTRSNAPFDPLQIHCGKVINNARVVSEGTISGIHYTVQEGSIPTITVKGNTDDFPTPFELYRIMEPLGKQFGAVKIDFNHCDNSPFNAFNLDTENFWFKPRKQHTNSYDVELQKRLKLHHDLYCFHKGKKDIKGNPTLGKIPSIDKRTLDLHRLRSCVQLRGGFDTVCQKKLWAQIGRELGYSGRIMSSLSTSLRSAYLKVFSEFDAYERQHKQAASHQVISSDMSIQQNSFYNTMKRTLEEDHRDALNPNQQTGPPVKIAHIENRINNEFGGSGKEYFRMRDILDAKGFTTRFGSVTEQKVGLTDANESTLPGYNFSLWNNQLEIYDKSMYEWKNSPIYNLRQYHEKAERHREIVNSTVEELFPHLSHVGKEISLLDFERLYYTILKEESLSFDVDTGIDLPTIVHGSTFSTSKMASSDETKRLIDAWNLNTINLSEKSLLQYQDLDFGNLAGGKIDVGMMLSTSGWALEDEFLPLLDFSYLGSSKVWYFVPPQYRNSLEALFDDIRNKKEVKSSDQFEADFTESDFFQSFQETNFLDQHKTSRKRSINHMFLKNLVQDKHNSYTPNDFQISTSELSASHIRYFKVIQDPKTFIMKYPQVYSTSISSGFQISEKSLFAPEEWVNNIPDAELWRAENKLLPSILPFQFFVNIVESSNDRDLLKRVTPLLMNLIKDELHFRSLVPHHIPRVSNKFDPISDIDLSPCGGSKIVIANDFDCVTISVKQFLELEKKLIDLGDSKVELHEYYSESYLKGLISRFSNENLQTQTATDREPSLLRRIESLKAETNNDSKITFNELNRLLLTCEDGNNEEYLPLKEVIKESQRIMNECQDILERAEVFKSEKFHLEDSFAMRRLEVPHFDVTIDELNSVCRELNKSYVRIEIGDNVKILVSTFTKFQKEAQLNLDSDDLTQLKKIYANGLSLGVRSKYLEIYADKITKLQWLNVYENVFVNHTVIADDAKAENYSLTSMRSYLSLGVELFGDLRLTELETVADELKNGQSVMTLSRKLLADKTHRMKVTELEELVRKANSLLIPWGSSLKVHLETISKTITNARSILLPMQKRLSTNEAHISAFETAISAGNLTDTAILKNFDGSEDDKRLTQTEAIQSLEHPLYSKHMKSTKLWQQEFNKVFVTGKAGLKALLKKAGQCWDPTDLYSSTEENNNKYCFCRRGDNGNVMVQCEICSEWYHTSCINGGKWLLPEDDGTVFCCEICLHPTGNSPTGTISLDQIRMLVLQSGKLSILPERALILDLFELFKLSDTYFAEANQMMFTLEQSKMETTNTSLQELVKKVKFHLRKILGAGVTMPDITNRMTEYCRYSDELKTREILKSNIKIISGYPEK